MTPTARGIDARIRPDIRPCALTARMRARSLNRSRMICASLSSSSARLPPVRFCSRTAETKNCASIDGIRKTTSNPKLKLPKDPQAIPDVITQALSALRLAGVDGPYSVLLSADVYTKVSETTEHGYPILEHIDRLVPGDIIWAPAIDGAFVLTTRGGDFDLQLGTDVSIGYTSHDADTVQLYLQETLTFLCYTAEASVALSV